MNGAVKQFRGKAGIVTQIVSIILLLFFSIIIVNLVDFSFIHNNEAVILSRFGIWSFVFLLLVTAILYAGAVPSSILGAASGAVLGIFQGLLIYISAVFIGSLIIYYISRTFMQKKLLKLINKNKLLKSLENTVEKEGFRFLFLLRFVPVHATFVSALFGISGIKPARFLISCLFLLPELILQVYLGYMAVSMPSLQAGSWGIANLVRIISLFIAIAAIGYAGWIARKSIQPTTKIL